MTKKQIDELWGDGGPYSQVNLIFENRILDDKEARKYYYVQAEINPLTFETVKDGLDDFRDDEWVMAICETGEEREDENGYNAYPFRMQNTDKNDLREAEKSLEEIKKAVIRMHKYTMEVLGIVRDI